MNRDYVGVPLNCMQFEWDGRHPSSLTTAAVRSSGVLASSILILRAVSCGVLRFLRNQDFAQSSQTRTSPWLGMRGRAVYLRSCRRECNRSLRKGFPLALCGFTSAKPSWARPCACMHTGVNLASLNFPPHGESGFSHF